MKKILSFRKFIANRIMFIVRICAYLIIATAIVFIIVYACRHNTTKCCCSNESDFYYNLAVGLATIGFGLATVMFSACAEAREKSKKHNDEVMNTKICCEKFGNIISSKEFLFLDKVFNKLSKDYHLDTISESFYVDQYKYYDNYLELAGGDENIDSFFDNLESITNDYLHYLVDGNRKLRELKEMPKATLIEECLNKVMRQLEPICYEYMNFTIMSHIFIQKMLPTIKKLYLRTYFFLPLIGLEEEDLIYMKFSLLLKSNDNVIIKIEKE